MSAPDARRLLGQVISGRYRIDELIGEGGMGAIYRATHTHMRKRLAVKVLHAEMLDVEEAVLRFEREAVAGAHIDHPNVATATDFGKLDDGSHFLVLEYLEGDDLRSVIARGPLPPDRATRIARQIAMALRASHQLGIVHRDLKPENVMLVRRDREMDVVKVLDFGIAKVPVDQLAKAHGTTAAALTQRGMVYGTPEYMSPEQALGEDVDGRADLYALGVVYFEMLTGSRPFNAANRSALLEKVVRETAPRVSSRLPAGGVPEQVDDLVASLLEKTAAARTQSADEVIDALDVAIFEQGWVTPPAPSAASRASFASLADRSGDHPAIRIIDPSGHTAAAIPSVKRTAVEAVPPVVSAGASRASIAERAPRSRALPSSAAVAGLGAVAIGLLVVGAVAFRDAGAVAALEVGEPRSAGVLQPASSGNLGGFAPTPTATAAAAGEDPDERREGSASADELAAARSRGLAALGPLAQKYPTDPNVLEALLLAHAAERTGLVAAMGVAKRLLEIAPDKAADEDVRGAVLRACNGTPEAATAAFEVVTTRMGSRGPDLLYDLVSATSVGKLPRDRAERLLADPKVMKQATPALLIALELRKAQPCARKPLFPRAGKDGDARSLHFLRPLLVTNGCTSGGGNPFAKIFGQQKKVDCHTCLGDRADLRAAVDAIEQRTGRPSALP